MKKLTIETSNEWKRSLRRKGIGKLYEYDENGNQKKGLFFTV